MTPTTVGVAANGIHERGAQVRRVPPPLYFGAAFGVGMLLRATTVPLDFAAGAWTVVPGVIGLTAGGVLAASGVLDIARHHTTIVPHQPVSTLVTSGVYRFTRNPMYTGLAVAYLGGALLAGSGWPVATLGFALLAVRKLVIDPEESYLAGKFGRAYADYRARVRRWL